jgi:hypothetical protein
LTDLELAALNNVVQLDMDPHGRIFDYNKVAGLFSEANGTRAHSMTKDALATIVLKRPLRCLSRPRWQVHNRRSAALC